MTINVAHPLGVMLALLPEAFLVLFALLALLVVAWRHRTAQDSRLAGWVSLAGLLAASAALAWLWVGHTRAAGATNMIALDDFRYAAAALILAAGVGTVLLSLAYLQREDLLAPEYYVLLLLATAGMLLLAGADDLMVLFLGLEIMSIGVYVLAGFDRRDVFSGEAALKYFLIGAFASAFLLYGIALVYGATASTSLSEAALRFGQGTMPLMGSLGLALLLIGFGFKVAAVPFHMWTPDVYEGAPTPVTGFMATGVKVAGFAALARILLTTFGSAVALWQPVVVGLAVLSMVVGNLVALNQRSVKRMLAYSSIAHAGYLFAALVPGSPLGATAVIVYLAAYVFTSLAAFGLLSVLGRDGEREVSLDSLAGLAQRRPWVAAGLSVCMLSLLGFPGTFGFIGKWLILFSLIGTGHPVVAVVLVLTSVLSAGYYLPVIMAAYMRPAEEGAGARESLLGRPAAMTVAVAVVLVLLFGVWPTPLLDLAQASATSLYEALMSGAHHALR